MTVVPSNYARAKNDLYQTEPWATEVLLKHFPLKDGAIWEPAAGNHLMAHVLRGHGYFVFTSDIETYDRPHMMVADFLQAEPICIKHLDGIITNPPYGKGNRLAVKFIERALDICDGPIAMLLTAKFDFGKTRQHLFKDNRRFMAKIALMDRLSWTLDGETGTEDHAWYIWSASNAASYPPVCLYEGKQ